MGPYRRRGGSAPRSIGTPTMSTRVLAGKRLIHGPPSFVGAGEKTRIAITRRTPGHRDGDQHSNQAA